MSAVPAGFTGVPPGAGTGGTVWGVASVREALGRFQTLITLGLAVAAIVIVEDVLHWAGVTNQPTPIAPRSFADWWPYGLGVGIQVALGVAIAILVIFGIIYAILGLIAWRRGVLAMTNAAPEFGPAQIEATRRARQEHSMTLWLFLVYVLVAIAVAIIFAAVDATLSAAQVASVPAIATSVATGIATSLVLFVIYDFGSRHLVRFLSGISSPDGRALLDQGRYRLLVGAGIGVGAALAPVFWGFDGIAVVSLAVILFGVRDLLGAYQLWLNAHAPVWQPLPGSRASTA